MTYKHNKRHINFERLIIKVVGFVLIALLAIFLGFWVAIKVIEHQIDQDIQSRPKVWLERPQDPTRAMIKSGVNYGEQHTNHAKIQVTADDE